MKLYEKDAFAVIDIYEKEVFAVLSEVSGKEAVDASQLTDRPWHNPGDQRIAADDDGRFKDESFASGFIFGIFVARGVLVAAERAMADQS